MPNRLHFIPWTRLVIETGHDRFNSPFIALARLADKATRDLPMLSGREFRITWGGWWCAPHIDRHTAAIGRLWLEW